MPVFHSPVYVAFLLLLVVALAVRVSQLRARKKVTFGDGGDKELRIAIRRHGNSLEHAVVLSLLALVFDLQRAPFGTFNLDHIERSLVGELLLWLGLAARALYAAGSFRKGRLHVIAAGATYLSELGLCLLIFVTALFP